MIIARYGIKLIRLTEDHIETLRQWRNDEKISRYMEFREYITPEMQQRWFAGLDPLNDFYFMIEYQGQLVGMIHCSDIDWQKGTGNAGLFIYNSDLQSTHVPVLASLAMVDAFFGLTRLNTMFAKVMKGNLAAERYNTNLGFQKLPDQEELAFQEYELDKDDYFSKTNALRERAQKVARANDHVTVSKVLYDKLLAQDLLLSDPTPEFANMLQVTD